MGSDTSNLYRIQHISGKFRLLLSFLIVLIPVANLAYWFLFNSLPPGVHSGLPVRVRSELPLVTLLLAFLASLLPVSATLYGAVKLRRLFVLYEQGIVFTERNVSCFRHIAYALLYWVAANFMFVFLFSLIMKLTNTAGSRLVLQFSSSDIRMLITGGVLLLISWVMKEAVELEDEHVHTV